MNNNNVKELTKLLKGIIYIKVDGKLVYLNEDYMKGKQDLTVSGGACNE